MKIILFLLTLQTSILVIINITWYFHSQANLLGGNLAGDCEAKRAQDEDVHYFDIALYSSAPSLSVGRIRYYYAVCST